MKVLTLILAMIMLVGLVGCGANPEDSEPSSVPESTTPPSSSVPVSTPEESSELESTPEEEISYAAMIPDPNAVFVNGTVSVTDGDGGTAYIFEVTGYNDGEMATYISGCKDMGFNDVSYETDVQFGAYTSDGAYWVQINLDSEKEIIYIICQESK